MGKKPGAGTRQLATNKHLFRSTGVVSTACREAGALWADGLVGEARGWRRSRLRTSPERALASGVLVNEERGGDWQ
jgi:hypothetical protein